MGDLSSKKIILLCGEPALAEKIKQALLKLGIKKLNEASDLDEAKLAFMVRDFDLAIFKFYEGAGSDAGMDMANLSHTCSEKDIPMLVFAEKTSSPGKIPLNATRLDADISSAQINEAVVQALNVKIPGAPKAKPEKSGARALLAQLKFFEKLSPPTLSKIMSLGSLKSFPENVVAFKKDVHGTHFCIIIAGTLKVMLGKREVATLEKGDIFGEMSLIMPKQPRKVSIVTSTPGKIFVLPQGFLKQLPGEGQVEVYQSIMVSLVEKLKKTTNRLNEAG